MIGARVARFVTAVVLGIACMATPAFAASDYYLEIDGIRGESKAIDGAIEIASWSWGASNTGSAGKGSKGGGMGTGKVSLQDFSMHMFRTRATPQLLLACATGQHIKSAVLTCRKTGDSGSPATFLKIELKEVMISSYQSVASPEACTGEDEDCDGSADELSISFQKITMTYFVQGSNGQIEEIVFTYDLKKNVKV